MTSPPLDRVIMRDLVRSLRSWATNITDAESKD